ncbi:MAG: 4Fe-4S dicluster domain-containing protein [Peptococcaceae bacterium]|jgi:Fe-S oxidoreductase/nitrate reductase gamma subunit|nr:4Fe-4S dicluster domain-containing protein [Peptococcaceae bacterium]
MPTREIYWNIDMPNWLYLFFAVALITCLYGFYRRFKLWRLGQKENRFKYLWRGIKDILAYGFAHKRILRDPYPGIVHFFIFWGFVFLVFATTVVFIQADLGLQIFQGNLYLFIKVTANLFGLTALIAVVFAMYRRYVIKPAHLESKSEDAVILILLFVILVTGFIIEGVRMAAVPDPWEAYGFVGAWLAVPLRLLSLETLLLIHKVLWWFHMAISMAFIAYLPYSKLIHIPLTLVNILLRRRGPIGVSEPIDFEDESLETYGKNHLRELTWKELFNADVCMKCGRCEKHCPAHSSGKSLNPKQIVQNIRSLMEEAGTPTEATSPEADHELIGRVATEQDIWACTTCRSCEQQCPVFIEHVDKLVEMRRYLTLMETSFPPEMKQLFKNLETNANPWGISWNTRHDFLQACGVKTVEENPDAEYLYFPGCYGCYDARNQKVTSAVVKLLQTAGINFATLGDNEKCCGDPARRLGHEYLFAIQAQENIELMKNHGVKKIITQCPHCFNTLKNEYPDYGGNFEVIHHVELLTSLVKSGKLQLKTKFDQTITYHDSCYLGRYQQIYNEPRNLLKATGLELKEMKHHHKKSLCCGAGGGRMWLEENEGERINVMRTDEALAVNPDYIATACPYCLSMFDDGLATRKARDKVETLDVAEILEKAL